MAANRIATLVAQSIMFLACFFMAVTFLILAGSVVLSVVEWMIQ